MTTFEPPIYNTHIYLVGCGGTGSALARHVARIAYDMKTRNLDMPKITFIDDDTVEAKNLGRQMFSFNEIGKNKAQVLAQRFNRVLGLKIEAIPKKFDQSMVVTGRKAIILGAVDNHLARLEISKLNQDIWIDAGNKKDAGQVSIGTTSDQIRLSSMLNGLDKKSTIQVLPHVGYLFPELLEPEEPQADDPAVSCADLLMFGEQDILINDMMANVAGQYLKKLLYRQHINTFCTFIDSDLLSMRSLQIDAGTLGYYIQKEAVA